MNSWDPPSGVTATDCLDVSMAAEAFIDGAYLQTWPTSIGGLSSELEPMTVRAARIYSTTQGC